MPKRLCPTVLLALVLAATAFGGDTFDEEVSAVERLRGAQFKSPIERRTMPRSELRVFLRKQLDKEQQGGAAGYLRALAALYLVRDGTTVEPMLDLYDAQVLAFYDPVTHIYYSLDAPPPNISLPAPMASAIEVHELVHALQDQRFDAGPRSVAKQADWDALTAYQSLLEGEAVLVMLAYLGDSMGAPLDTMLEQDSIVEAIRGAASQGSGASADVPDYFVKSLQFPYVEGLAFVIDAYKQGGWKRIDAIHADPPVSTEEIIHPEIYKARVAAGGPPPKDAVIPGGKSDLVDTVLGEFNWNFMLGNDAAAGWASDFVRVLRSGTGVTVLVESSWDTAADAKEFVEAYHAWLETKKATNIRMVTLGKSVKAAYGVDPGEVRKFMTPRASERE